MHVTLSTSKAHTPKIAFCSAFFVFNLPTQPQRLNPNTIKVKIGCDYSLHIVQALLQHAVVITNKKGPAHFCTIVSIVNAIDDVIDNVNDDLTIAELCGLNIVLISLYF